MLYIKKPFNKFVAGFCAACDKMCDNDCKTQCLAD